MNIDIKFKKTLHNFKSYVMHIYYNHRYNLYFQINDNKIKYFFLNFKRNLSSRLAYHI